MYKDGPEFGGGSDPAMGELDPSVVTLVGDQQPDAQEASPETGDQIPAYTAAEQLSSPEDGEQSRDRASARLLGRVANIAGRLAEGINNRRTLSEVASDTKEAFGARVNGASDRIKSIAQTSLDVTKDIAIGVGVEAVYLVTEPVKVLGKSVIRAGIGVGRQAAKAADSMYSGLDKMGSSIDAKMFATEEAMKNGVESTRTFFKDKAEAAKTRKEERSDRVALKRIARGEKISENIAALKYQVNETISARQDARTEKAEASAAKWRARGEKVGAARDQIKTNFEDGKAERAANQELLEAHRVKRRAEADGLRDARLKVAEKATEERSDRIANKRYARKDKIDAIKDSVAGKLDERRNARTEAQAERAANQAESEANRTARRAEADGLRDARLKVAEKATEEHSDRIALKRIARGEKISENIAALKYQVNETISARQDARTESDREQDLRKAGLQVSETDQQQEASDGQSEQTESVVPEGDVASLANQSVGEVQEETPIGRQTREALKARAEAARRSREASAEGGTTTTEAPEELALAA
jgi:hypothetical protein